MAAQMIPAGETPVLLEHVPPGPTASPQAHADWCAQRGWECVRRMRLCRHRGLPRERWLTAARLFRMARQAWRARAKEAL
jgi:hypothetical protein